MGLSYVLFAAVATSSGTFARPAEEDPCLGAQIAIERVRARHTVGAATAPSEQKLADSARAALDESHAAAARRAREGGAPITSRLLDEERDRVDRETRLPGRLRELYDALGGDPHLIRECLLRPILEDRLARGVSAQPGIGLSSRGKRVVPQAPGVSPGSWDNGVFDAPPEGRAQAVAVWTGSRIIVWGGGEHPGLTSGGIYDPAGNTWAPMSSAGAPNLLPGAAGFWTGDRLIVFGPKYDYWGAWGGGLYDPELDTWSPIDVSAAPSYRTGYSVVWAGNGLIVWGGSARDPITNGTLFFNDGAFYDPVADSWSPVNSLGAPSARKSHAAVWTGLEMIVWSGQDNDQFSGPWLDTGAAYNPATGLWRTLATVNAPPGRSRAITAWTGTEMLIWSGYPQRGPGGLYDPATDTWRGLTPQGEPEPILGQQAVWTGDRFAVLGGELSNYPGFSAQKLYDPVTDTWESISSAKDPSPRTFHVLVSYPGFLFVWGGNDENFAYPRIALNTGGIYDLARHRWSATSIGSGPPARGWNAKIWTGNEMIVWGGDDLDGELGTGYRFDPALASWRALPTKKAPAPRAVPLAVWTGSEMIVWGGFIYDVSGAIYLQDGARYDPAKNKWKKMKAKNPPPARFGSSAVWTGKEMIVWGGLGQFYYSDEGARYDPVAETWKAMSISLAPTSRQGHSAVWTGTEMLIWGGFGSAGSGTRGGRYDPITDSWGDIPPDPNAASADTGPVVWTGNELIYVARNSSVAGMFGGRFDPVSGTWSPLDLAGAPPVDQDFYLVWTGDRVFVWGGGGFSFSLPRIGAGLGVLYDPASDTWEPLPMEGAPDNRIGAAAFWTGSEVLIWGGTSGSTLLGNGGAFTPSP